MKHRRQRGISIIESLVAMVVICVGMLGIAGLYLSSLQASRSAKFRAAAVELVGSLADRIRANRDATTAYNLAIGGTPALKGCNTATRCSAAALAEDDLARWLADLKAGLVGGTAITGTVAVTDRARPLSDNYVITVTWKESDSDINYNYVLSLNIANPL